MEVSSDKQALEEYKKQQQQDFFEYAKKTKSPNSLRAYRFAWNKFTKWCQESGYSPLDPPTPYELLIGLFLASMAKSRELKPASLSAYLAGIKHFYAGKGISIDTSHEEIRKVMAGIRREQGTKQTKKLPLTTDNIKILIDSIGEKKPIDIRDRAMILIGFAGALRRSELVGIDREHLTFGSRGGSIFIPSANQEGRTIELPSSEGSCCPVRALQAWLHCCEVIDGPIFRPITKGGRALSGRLGSRTAAIMLKKRCKVMGDVGEVAGNSLRAG